MASLYLLASLSLAFLCICQADLISDVCSQAVNPTLCTQILRSDPRAGGADLKGLGLIVIEKAEAATQDAIGVIKTFNTAKTKGIVDTCVETSTDAIDNLKQCSQLLKNYNGKDKVHIQDLGSGALTNAGTCDDEWGNSEPPKVKDATKKAQDVIDIFLVIANKL